MRGAEHLALHALHAAARAAFRVLPPLRAKAAVDWLARCIPPLASDEEARRALRELGTGGVCLTRAATIAALLPGAELVIGVDSHRGLPLRAHAWVAVHGEPLAPDPQTAAFVPLAYIGAVASREK
jgi:hypothetical protein